MKRVSCAMVMCILGGAVAASYGQCDDAYDKVLCVTKLDDATAGGFDATDGSLSSFWASVDGDFIELEPTDPQYCDPSSCQATDAQDAKVYVKAAASNEALFVYIEVQDNVWVDWVAPTHYGDDSVDLYYDEQDAESAWANPEGPYNSHLTRTMKQFQVFMGATTVPQELRVTWYDAENYTWNNVAGAKQVYTFAEAKEKWGIEVDVIEVDATHKQQEWKLPWWGYANGSFVEGTDLSNKRIAFAGGYNDVDTDDDVPDELRWPGPSDPWVSTSTEIDNQYGDMLLPDGIIVTGSGNATIPRSARGTMPQARNASTQLYTLTGQRVSHASLTRGGTTGILVQRRVLSNGSVVAGRMHIAR